MGITSLPHSCLPTEPRLQSHQTPLAARLKADFSSNLIASSIDEFIDQLCSALCHFMDDIPKTASQCAFRK
jgi:hypothetical protein